MSTSQRDLTKHAATQLASLIVKVSQSEDELIRAIAKHLEIQTNLYQTLNECRDFIASDRNCGPQGLGLICMVDDVLAKARGES